MFNSPPFDVLGDPVKSLHKARNVSEICRVFRSSSLSENAACFLLLGNRKEDCVFLSHCHTFNLSWTA
nr:MAG TPA: hypothetical protein [Caudoviricetes sp.]